MHIMVIFNRHSWFLVLGSWKHLPSVRNVTQVWYIGRVLVGGGGVGGVVIVVAGAIGVWRTELGRLKRRRKRVR